MAASLSFVRRLMPSNYDCFYMARIPVIGTLFCIRNNSNTASITRTKKTCYPKMYPTLLVFPDGSTINVRYKEPRKIIKLPLDFSKLPETERKKVLANRKPKQKLEVIEDFGDRIDISEYSKYFKQ